MMTDNLNAQAEKFARMLDAVQKSGKSEKNKKKRVEQFLKMELNVGQSKIGITRKDKSQSKKKRKIAKLSAKINRVKERHHWTTKEKKSR